MKARSIVDKFKSKQDQLEKMLEQFKENTFTEKEVSNEKDKNTETI